MRTTWLQHVVSRDRDYRSLLPLYFLAAESWDLSGFDLVISSSHCVAKAARRGPSGFHLCYCHTPGPLPARPVRRLPARARAAREGRGPPRPRPASRPRRRDGPARRRLPRELRERARADRAHLPPRRPASSRPRPTRPSTRPRRRRAGARASSSSRPSPRTSGSTTPSRRPRASASRSRSPGSAPRSAGCAPSRDRTSASPGLASDEELRELYRSAEAVLMPGEEDFGIVPLEAQACGTPVVALGKGGALETVVDGVTGVLYPEAGPGPLAGAIERARASALRPGRPRREREPLLRARVPRAIPRGRARSSRRGRAGRPRRRASRRGTLESDGRPRDPKAGPAPPGRLPRVRRRGHVRGAPRRLRHSFRDGLADSPRAAAVRELRLPPARHRAPLAGRLLLPPSLPAPRRDRSSIDEALAIVMAASLATLLLVGLLSFWRVWSFNRTLLVLFLLLDILLVSLGRFAIWRYLEKVWTAGVGVRRALIVGAGESRARHRRQAPRPPRHRPEAGRLRRRRRGPRRPRATAASPSSGRRPT